MGLASKKKPGKVLRVDDLTWGFIRDRKKRGEKITHLVRRLLGLPSKSGESGERTEKYALPSDLFDSPEEARGAAVLRAVRSGSKETEEPVSVREVG